MKLSDSSCNRRKNKTAQDVKLTKILLAVWPAILKLQSDQVPLRHEALAADDPESSVGHLIHPRVRQAILQSREMKRHESVV